MYHKVILVSTLLLWGVVNSQTYTIGLNVVPVYDICANGGDSLSCSNHGSCVNDACVCSGGYTGRDCSVPPGGFSYPNPIPPARATYFANLDGSDGQLQQTTCFGDFPSGEWVSREYLPTGVTGIAAVNPTVYGSRFAFGSANQYTDKTVTGTYAGVGQACGQCFNLTNGVNSVVVMVVDRCGGFCQAESASGPCNTTGVTGTDCGYCVTPTTTPTTIDCSCMSESAITYNGYCDSTEAHHCDHCAQNDHAHFDLDTDSFTILCGSSSSGVCNLDSFQWVQCGGIQAQAGSYPYGSTAYVLPSNAVESGSATDVETAATSAPISTSTTAPTKAPTKAPTAAPTTAPTKAPTVAPTKAPTTAPTKAPTVAPTKAPTAAATKAPTQKPSTSATPAPTTRPTPSPTSASSSTTCTSAQTGYMKCTGTSTYSTCANGEWQANQSCQAGLVCEVSGQYIYCV